MSMSDLPDPDRQQRLNAYSAIKEAKSKLNVAAMNLGFDDVYGIMQRGDDIDATPDHRERDALRAITDAYSFLDNGSVEGILPDDD